MKVDGEEFDAPQADIDEAGGLTAYRAGRAAENRLKKANETLAEARRMMAETLTQRQPAAPAVPQKSDLDFIAEKMDVVRFGTPQEGAAAQLEIFSRLRGAQPDENAIVTRATASMKHDSARASFNSEFVDLMSNPLLKDLVELQVGKQLGSMRLPDGQPDWGKLGQLDFQGFYRTIGNQVRSVAGRPSQPAPTTAVQTASNPSPAPSDKEARKASIVTIPTAAARAALPAESKPETREETLASMRKLRGLPNG